jgi:hypothetical protein
MKPMSRPARIALLATWVAVFGLGLASLGVFVQGLVRDLHLGDPELALDLSRPGDWQRATFRVWTAGRYRLWLQTVNHDPPFGEPFRGAVAVRLEDPSGGARIDRTFPGAALDHLRPENTHWTALDSLELEGRLWRGWRLAARVMEGDPAFAGAATTVTLRRVRYDPGMGGLINYVMLIPAMVLLGVAFALAFWLRAGAGPRAPLWISAGGLALLLLALTLLRP